MEDLKENPMRLRFLLIYFHCCICLAIVQMLCGFEIASEKKWNYVSVKWHYAIHKILRVACISSNILWYIMEKLAVTLFSISMHLDEILLSIYEGSAQFSVIICTLIPSEKNFSPICKYVQSISLSNLHSRYFHSLPLAVHGEIPHWENRAAFAPGAAQLCLISFLQWSEVKFELRHLHMAP